MEVRIERPEGSSAVVFGTGGQASLARFPIIAGPCVVESEEMLREVAEKLLALQEKLPIDFIFKASYRKANRTSATSFTGIGDEAALKLLSQIRTDYNLPVLTDIHDPAESALASQFADILQIPAFLARQTAILQAAARTGKAVNIKKGQFMAPQDMAFALKKVQQAAPLPDSRVMMTERGTFFGYGDLVVDFRSLEIMKSFGAPVIYDATHSVQRPSHDGISSGDRAFIPALARAACAVGVDGLFIETHPNPANALSDKATQWPLDQLEELIASVLRIRAATTNG